MAGIVFFTLVFPTSLSGQNEEYENVFLATRTGLLNSVEIPAKRELKFNIGHRFGELSGGLYEFFGLDQATIRLALDWGATDWLGFAFGRSTWEKTYDLSGKAALLRKKTSNYEFAVTGLLGWSVNTLRDYYPENEVDIWTRSSFTAQVLMAARRGRFSLQLSPLIFRNNYDPRLEGHLNLFSLPIAGSIRITEMTSFTAEYVAVFDKASFGGENPLTFSLDIDTGGHQFQLIFSNSRGLTEKTVLTNTDGKWVDGNIYFGFNLVRTFYL